MASDVVVGTISKIYQPREHNGKLTPGKIILDTDDGTAAITVWQLYIDSIRSEKMPEIFESLSEIEADVVGQAVAISCRFDKTYEHPTTGAVQQQYSKMTALKFIGGEPPKQAETKPVARTAPSGTENGSTPSTPSSESTNPMSLEERIAWNSAINNAVNAYSFQRADRYGGGIPAYLKLVVTLANELYPEIRRGPVEIVELEPKEQDEVEELTYLNDEFDSVIGEI
jgi:hypothetical protein